MSDQSGDVRYAPPQAQVADVKPNLRLSGHLATRGRRCWAMVIDQGIAMGILVLLAYLTPWNFLVSRNADTLWAYHFREVAFGFVLFVVLQGYLLITRSQTIGKVFLKTRIVRRDGTRASGIRIIGLRYGIAYLCSFLSIGATVFALADCLLIFRKSRCCLHDLVADTIVVNV